MRKLVRKDDDGALMEVDPKALRREALALGAYIQAAPAAEEAAHHYRSRLLPLVEAALNGSLPIPYKERPYNQRLMMEGLEPELPVQAQRLYVDFLLRIQGEPSLSSASVRHQGHYVPGAAEVLIDGRRLEWVEFED